MKKSLILLILVCISCASNNDTVKSNKTNKSYPKPHFTGKIVESNLEKIKSYYNWTDRDFLIINYKQPNSFCHFDNHLINEQTKKYWLDFYMKVDLPSSKIVHSYYHWMNVAKDLDNKIYFPDKDKFLYNLFFKKRESCFAVLILNKQGSYVQYNGHYSENQISNYLKTLQ